MRDDIKVHISNSALQRLTPNQLIAIQTMFHHAASDMAVTTAFELPQDFVAFTLGGIYGGIDSNGEVST